MADLHGLSLSLGTIANLERATAQAVAEPVAAARAYAQRQPTAYLDETGYWEGQQGAWLWTAVTTWGTVFVARRSRRGKVAQEMVGERFWGWLVEARWSGYNRDPTWRRQLCWVQLLRDTEATIAREGHSHEIGEGLRGHARKMFYWWHQVCPGQRLGDGHCSESLCKVLEGAGFHHRDMCQYCYRQVLGQGARPVRTALAAPDSDEVLAAVHTG
jgi:hypothetical protein